MAFADRLSQPGVALVFVLRVTGHKRLATSAKLPPDWDIGGGLVTYDGDSYEWDDALMVDVGWETSTAQANPKAGIAISGSQRFRIALTGHEGDPSTDVWLAQLATNIHRTGLKRAVLQTTLDANSTGPAVVDSTSEYGSSGEFHANLECIGFSGKTGTTFTGLTRGKYGSSAAAHTAETPGERIIGGGPMLTDDIMAWEGRLVELIACTGEIDLRTNVFTPYGANLDSDENEIVYAGIVTTHSLSPDLMTARLETADLTQLLARDVGFELPKARAGVFFDGTHNTGQKFVIDKSCWWVTFTWWNGSEPSQYALRLIRDDGGGGDEDVPEGIYDKATVGAYIAHTMKSTAEFTGDDIVVQLVVIPTTKKIEMSVNADLTNTSDPRALELNVLTGTKPNNVWKALGFEEDVYVDALFGTTTFTFSQLNAQRPVPLLYWAPQRYGKSETGNYILPYDRNEEGTPQFNAAPGWLEDDGTAIDGYVRISDHEVVRFDSVGIDNGVRYLRVVERGCFGSYALEELYIETDEQLDEVEQEDLTQGVAFINTKLGRALLYFILGGSGNGGFNDTTYDKGWRNSCIYIPKKYVNVASFEEFDRNRNPQRDGVAVFDAESFRSLIKDELIVEQIMVTAQNVGDGNGYRLAIVDMDHPTIDADDGQDLDDSTIWATGGSGIGVDTSHHKIINVIEWQGVYDHAKGKYRKKGRTLHQTSVATFGEKQQLPIRIRSIFSEEELERRMARFGARIFSAFAFPYIIIVLDVIGQIINWVWQLGSYVKLTTAGIPTLEAVGRGVTDIRCILLHRMNRLYMEEDDLSGRLTLRPANGYFAKWCPSARLISKSSDTSWTATPNAFSHADDDFVDLDEYKVGYAVTCHTPGDRSTMQTATIASVNPSINTITFDAPGITNAAPQVMRYVAYDHADSQEEQRKRLYMSDADHKLDLNGGDDDPHMEFL